ncbi:hypothetical protein HK105_204226 [Polyrhizophydium stewartii]|uniref:MYND-type domain-containing protein n=1 Tax=Polyrhizophydium stewartii TaxID=2732419 RepID=A0ABR4N9C1_9FUNG|nr:hypothetical protein HK105_003619 [Polyrhizophydium stewartii]
MDVHDAFWELATGSAPPVPRSRGGADDDPLVPGGDFHRSASEDGPAYSPALNAFRLADYCRATRPPLARALPGLADAAVAAAARDLGEAADWSSYAFPLRRAPAPAAAPASAAEPAALDPEAASDASDAPDDADPAAGPASLRLSGRLAPGQYFIPMMLRYSERMDIGCFFLFVDLGPDIGCVLLRAKPIGTISDDSPRGSGRLVIWDDASYGCCSRCMRRLARVQVCADCRVAQFCARHCQKLDWERGHRAVCRYLGLHSALESTDDPRDDEAIA